MKIKTTQSKITDLGFYILVGLILAFILVVMGICISGLYKP